eukprot:m.150559 g.150559  ORF g.150559 m.150559 type:complete len:788 (+) comp14233_c0_seq1:133-2496(+)
MRRTRIPKLKQPVRHKSSAPVLGKHQHEHQHQQQQHQVLVREAQKLQLTLNGWNGPYAVTLSDVNHRTLKVGVGTNTCSRCGPIKCVHAVFVLIRLLNLDPNSREVIAPKLQEYEVESLLSQHKEAPDTAPPLAHAHAGTPLHPPHSTASAAATLEPCDESCAICLSTLQERDFMTECHHCKRSLHFHCLTKWHSTSEVKTCPLCREEWVHSKRYNYPSRTYAHPASSLAPSGALQTQATTQRYNASDCPITQDSEQLETSLSAWSTVIGRNCACDLVSRDWRRRVAGWTKLKDSVVTGITSSPQYSLSEYTTLCQIVQHAANDPVFNVLELVLDVFKSLTPPAPSSHTALCIATIVRRASETNKRVWTSCLHALCEAVVDRTHSSASVLRCIINPPQDTLRLDQPWKWHLGSIKVFHALLRDYPTWFATIPKQDMIKFTKAKRRETHKRILSLTDRAQILIDNLPESTPSSLSTATDYAVDCSTISEMVSCQPPSPSCLKENVCDLQVPAFSNLYTEPTSWQCVRCIGAGAFGRVVLGQDSVSGFEFAAKQIICPTTEDRCLAKVQAEIDILKALDPHPNVVCYYGSCHQDITITIFLELLSSSLASLLKQSGPLTCTQTQRTTRDITSGLAYLHSCHIIHRDLKGANILLDENGIAKVSDFGAARQLQGLKTLTGEFKTTSGTPAWMSPEVIRGVDVSRKSDCWSLGCIVIEMATGQPPWAELGSQNPFALMYRIASTECSPVVPQQPALTDAGQRFCQDCFQRDVVERLSSSELLCHDFLKFTS